MPESGVVREGFLEEVTSELHLENEGEFGGRKGPCGLCSPG